MDDQPDGASPDAGGSPAAPVGRPRANFHQLRRAEFLKKIEAGKGIDQALREMDVTYWAYRMAVRDDAEFREEVASARRSADQTLDEVGHLLAFNNPDILVEVWKRRDQARLMRDARADRRAERSEDRADRLAREAQERADRLAREEAERAERDKERALRLHLAEMAAAAAAARAKAKGGDADKDDPKPVDLDRLTPEEQATYRTIARKLVGDSGDDEPA